MQKKIIPMFHYALHEGGYLFLGSSETVGDSSELFLTIDRTAKIFQAKSDYTSSKLTALSRYNLFTHAHIAAPFKTLPLIIPPAMISLREQTEKALLQNIGAVALLVDAAGNILYIHGRTGKYLEPCEGDICTNNVLKMAREGLQRELTIALHEAVKSILLSAHKVCACFVTKIAQKSILLSVHCRAFHKQ